MKIYLFGLLLAFVLACVLIVLLIRPVRAECVAYTPVPPNEPSGIKGCELYGVGIASTWSGPGVARNDCIYPWTDCQPIRITSLEPSSYGRWIEVIPTGYCDCFMRPGPNGEGPRIVDLPLDVVAALGLPGEGLWDVRVEAIETVTLGVGLPDTAMSARDAYLLFVIALICALLGGVGIYVYGRYRP